MCALLKHLSIPLAALFFFRPFGVQHQTSAVRTTPLPSPRWQLIESPTVYSITSVQMINSRAGFASATRLLTFDGTRWTFFQPQPPVPSIHRLLVENQHSVWIASVTRSYESELFHFDGTRWREIRHPLANMIENIALSQGKLWIEGVGEMACLDGSEWIRVLHPSTISPTRSFLVQPNGDLFLLTHTGILFRQHNEQWTTPLGETFVKQLARSPDGVIYALAGTQIYAFDGTRFAVHSEDSLLLSVTRISAIDSFNIWGVGKTEFVYEYQNNQWRASRLPTGSPLTDIQMITSADGWIATADGLFLRFTDDSQQQAPMTRSGFEQVTINQFGQATTGEYGVAIDDFNNDGMLDLYTVDIYGANRLFLLTWTGGEQRSPAAEHLGFRDEAAYRGITGIGAALDISPGVREIDLGVAVGDVDNDGGRDIYLTNLVGKNALFLNDGRGYFRNVSREPRRASGALERSTSAIFGDVDNDGDLDLFVTNEFTSNRLYLNDGTGRFDDITEQAGLKTQWGGSQAAFGDINGDGYLDLYVTNWSERNVLYLNTTQHYGSVRFEDVTERAGVGGEPHAKSNACVFADIDNDGDLDLFVTNRKTSNRLYRNDGDARFTDITQDAIGIDSMLSSGASFADFDHDGFLDLYVANVGNNVFYKNIDGVAFEPMTDRFGAGLGGYSTGTATGDLDGDGDVDLYVSNFIDAPSTIFLNKINDKNFLIVACEGTISNRDAIGAKVYVYTAGKANDQNHLHGFREIRGGSGYGSHSSRGAHFGVTGDQLYDVVVHFPASGVTRLQQNVRHGEKVFISEEIGFARAQTNLRKALHRLFLDPLALRELWKGVIILAFLGISNSIARRRYRWTRFARWAVNGIAALVYAIQIWMFIHEPFYLSTLLPLVSIASTLVLVHLGYDRIVLKRLAEQEKTSARDQIARDLHDDLASNLSSARFYLDGITRTSIDIPVEVKSLLLKTRDLVSEATDSLTDIVWTASPRHDTLGDLLARLRILVNDYCKSQRVTPDISISMSEKEKLIPGDVRRNLYLICKEAIINIVKHSAATEVKFVATLDGNILSLRIQDNGKGFHEYVGLNDTGDGDKLPAGSLGHGLRNMRIRAEQIKAILNIESSASSGTCVRVDVEMT